MNWKELGRLLDEGDGVRRQLTASLEEGPELFFVIVSVLVGNLCQLLDAGIIRIFEFVPIIPILHIHVHLMACFNRVTFHLIFDLIFHSSTGLVLRGFASLVQAVARFPPNTVNTIVTLLPSWACFFRRIVRPQYPTCLPQRLELMLIIVCIRRGNLFHILPMYSALI